MNRLVWKLLHPAVELEMMGYIPEWLHQEDPRSISKQLDAAYTFGGWQPFGEGEWTVLDKRALKYPGDPVMKPLAEAKLRDEVICYYGHDLFAVFQKDGSFEVARLD